MFLKRLPLLFYLFFVVQQASAQHNTPYFNHLSNVKGGLADNINGFFFEDSKGFMWISSIKGLNRFDGKKIQTFTNDNLKDSTSFTSYSIEGIAESADGNIWFGAHSGLFTYIRATNRFQKHTLVEGATEHYLIHKDPDGKLWVRVGQVRNGALWTFETQDNPEKGTKKGDKKCVMPIFREVRIFTETDSKGYATDFWGYVKSDLTHYKVKDIHNGKNTVDNYWVNTKNTSDSISHIRGICKTDAQVYWLATDKGLVRFERSGKLKIYNNFKNSTLGIINSVTKLNAHTLLLATQNEGILLFDINTERFVEQYAQDNVYTEGGVNTNTFNDIYIDKNENVWVSSWFNGVYYTNFKKAIIPTYKLNIDNKNQDIRCAAENADGTIWLGTGIGLLLVDKNWQPIKKYVAKSNQKYSLSNNIIYGLDIDKNGNLWVSTSNSVQFFDRKTEQFYAIDNVPKNLKIRNVLVSNDGQVLSNTNQNILKLSVANKVIKAEKLNDIVVGKLWQSKINYFLGTGDKKIIVFDESFRKKTELPFDADISSFVDDPNAKRIWICNDKKLRYISTNDWQIYELDNSPAVNFTLGFDAQGFLWSGTSLGLSRYDTVSKQWYHFSKNEGTASIGFFHLNLKASDACLYLGGINGVCKIMPNMPNPYVVKPKATLTDIWINENPYKDPINLANLDNLKLDYDSNTVTFYFTGIDFSDFEHNSLSFQLEGYDPNPVKVANTEGVARYVKLPPGSYVFRVKAYDALGREASVLTYRLTIKTPWYMSYWFYGFIVASIAGIVYMMYRQRLNRIKAKAALDNKIAKMEMRTLIAKMNPHFIFNALGSIKDFVLTHKPDDAADFLDDFSRLMRTILEQTSKETIEIAREKALLTTYLQLESLRFNNSFDFYFDIDDAIDDEDTMLPTMVLQPLIENAIIHGVTKMTERRGKIWIRFELENADDEENMYLIVKVEDNGRGRRQKTEAQLKTHKSMATDITLDRLEILNFDKPRKTEFVIYDKRMLAEKALEEGKILTEDEKNGTLVVFRFPI